MARNTANAVLLDVVDVNEQSVFTLKMPHVFTVQACDFTAAHRENAACFTPIRMKITNAQQQVS